MCRRTSGPESTVSVNMLQSIPAAFASVHLGPGGPRPLSCHHSVNNGVSSLTNYFSNHGQPTSHTSVHPTAFCRRCRFARSASLPCLRTRWGVVSVSTTQHFAYACSRQLIALAHPESKSDHEPDLKRSQDNYQWEDKELQEFHEGYQEVEVLCLE